MKILELILYPFVCILDLAMKSLSPGKWKESSPEKEKEKIK